MNRIGFLGSGTWGCALANLVASNGHDVMVWSAIENEINYLKQNNTHPNMPDVPMAETITYTADKKELFDSSDTIVMSVPSVYLHSTLENCDSYYNNHHIVSVIKGIDASSLKTFSQIIDEKLKVTNKTTVLTGPTHAEEVIKKFPTTIVAANKNLSEAEYIRQIFMNNFFRVYTSADTVGSELCGALKNIIALAAGMSDGIGYGDNAKAAIITRGLTEIKRLGKIMGAEESTFGNLAGIGDLIVTCTSNYSRNHNAGELIGKGYSVEKAIKEIGMVVEGLNVLPVAMALAKKYHVELPIIFEVNEIIHGKNPRDAVNSLMNREKSFIK